MLTICLLATATPFFQMASAVPKRFSQLEGNRHAAPISTNDKSAQLSSSNSFEDNNSAAANHDGNDDHDDHICSDGWMNFHNRVCFNGLKIKRPFFEGVKDCGDLGANFTSIHSMEEFNFITSHWYLHEYWIGIIRGDYRFEDGTKVNQTVAREFDKYVPWADGRTQKGFICRAAPMQENAKETVEEKSAEHDSSFEHEDDVDNSSMDSDEHEHF